MKPYKNVYSAEEYKQLQELNEAALEQNKILKRQLDEAMEKQKVELPRKVVEAIEGFRELGWEPHDIFQISYDPTDGQWSSELNKYITIKSNGARKLMEALVNGYMVEQTPAEKLHTKVEELIFNWIGSLDVDEEEVHQHAMTKMIAQKITS